ncbi:MAG: hypothetical protein MJE77_07555 [Proteobacteria bacterium]|nr:hypothetical protein [Pseudomonadota bacterium]
MALRWAMVARCIAHIALFTWALNGRQVWAQTLSIAAPVAAVGDGATSIEIQVHMVPAGRRASASSPSRRDVTKVVLSADAGRVGPPAMTERGGFSFQFVPPRVATEHRVSLVARASLRDRRRLYARATIAVRPDPVQPSEFATGGAFDLRGPDRIRLTSGMTAAISIRKPNGPRPDLIASVGTLSPLVAAADGRLIARYTPPPTQYPQTAIIAAVSADRSAYDWMSIPLHGDALIDLKSESGASVAVTVGDQTFGPVRMNRQGKASITVVVPPGVNDAQTTATDNLGNTKQAILPLPLSSFPRTAVLCPRASARILVFSIDALGQPLGNGRVSLTPSHGGIIGLTPVGPGVHSAQYSVPPGIADKEQVTFTAAVDGEIAWASRCTERISVEKPSRLVIHFGVPAYVAGTGNSVEITVLAEYPDHRPALPVSIQLDVDAGAITALKPRASGGYTARWTLPDQFEGRSEARVTARAADLPAAVGALPLRPGPVAELQLSSSHTRVTAGSRSAALLRAVALDRHGNPVPQAHLTARSSGSIEPFAGQGRGIFTARYRAPDRPLTDRIVVSEKTSGVEATLAMAVLPHRRFAVSIKAGYVSNTSVVSAPFLALGGGYILPVMGGAVALGVDTAVYASSKKQRAEPLAEDIQTDVVAVPILARATAVMELTRLAIYVGVGSGAVLGRVSVSSPETGDREATRVFLAVSGLCGADIPAGPGRILGEISYLHAAVDEPFAVGNVGGIHAAFGYRYRF